MTEQPSPTQPTGPTPPETAAAPPEQPAAEQPAPDQPAAEQTKSEAPKKGKEKAKAQPKAKSPKAKGPAPQELIGRIGTSSEQALAYVLDPDPRYTRLARKTREALIQELPPMTGAALLGPGALARQLIASSAAGRYRDLFVLWQLFATRPEDCKPELGERPTALGKARRMLATATVIGLRGRAERVAEDVTAAQGLVWQWLREVVDEHLDDVARRPWVAAALLRREPDTDLKLPDDPDVTWLEEALAARAHGPLPAAIDERLAANLERLPVRIETLAIAQAHYPQRVPALLDRVPLDAEQIGAILAWSRDHGHGEVMHARIAANIEQLAGQDRGGALALWARWRDAGIVLPLPAALSRPEIEGLDPTRTEVADLLAHWRKVGQGPEPQPLLERLAAENRQRAEKAYEAFVCAGLDVTLPEGLEGNPIVKEGTRCPHCAAWTWVRPGHERRCPRAPQQAPAPAPEPATPAS